MGSGDREQFGQFMVSRWPRLARLAYGLTGDQQTAEDLAQTALASAYATWWRVRRDEDQDAYVRKLLISAYNSWSRKRRAAESPGPQQAAGEPAPEPTTGEQPALLTALAELPPQQRAVIVLRYWEDMNDAQLAATLRCTERTVRNQAGRALAALGPGTGPEGGPPLAERIRKELSELPVPPPPVSAITYRGRAKRSTRRWAFTGGVALVAVAAAAVALVQPGKATPRHAVTLNKPNPSAPAGVFASGTANGKPWRLAVRNVAGVNGTCLPAVMLNGRDGDVLFRPEPPAEVNPAFVTSPPGFPGIEFVVALVSPKITAVTLDSVAGRLPATPITVTECGQRFHVAGWALRVSRHRLPVIDTYTINPGLDEQQVVSQPAQEPISRGVWQNIDIMSTDVSASSKTSTIAHGVTGNASWKIQVSLGLFGECYTGVTTTSYGPGQAEECQPVEATPAGLSLAPVPFPADTSADLSGYAGPVSPRAVRAVARLSDGSTKTLTPVTVSGRKYVAVIVTGQVRVARIWLQDASGHEFGTTSLMPLTN